MMTASTVDDTRLWSIAGTDVLLMPSAGFILIHDLGIPAADLLAGRSMLGGGKSGLV
jgi:hypothetical protein